MIVESSITVYVGGTTSDPFQDLLDELRWLCNALIDDDVLREQIVTAAREQSGLHRDNAGDRMITMWARRLVIKDCIAAANATAPSLIGSDDSTSPARVARSQRVSVSHLKLPAETLHPCMHDLAALPRFVFVLKEIEGYAYRHISNLLRVGEAQCEAAYSIAVEQIGSRLAAAQRPRVLKHHTFTGRN